MRFRERFARFMYGRYGMDNFGKFIFYFALGMMIVNIFIKTSVLYFISLALLIYGYFRCFSRNTYKRSYENDSYMRISNRVRAFFNKHFGNRGSYSSKCNSYSGNAYTVEYKIFKCPKCKQKLRVPKGKGKIMISCRKCGNEFVKRS